MPRLWTAPPTALAFLALSAPLVLGGSSNSLLDISPDGKYLLCANADNDSVSVVDLPGRKLIREIPVGDQPEGVTWLGDGPLAAVTLYRDDRVVVLDAMAGRKLREIAVPAEPYGIVAARDGRRAWVTNEYPGVVSELDVEQGRVVREIPAGPFPRGLAVDAAEKYLFVTGFHDGVLRKLDLATGEQVDRWQGHSTDNLARSVALHPGRPKAYVPHIRSMVGVAQGNGSIFPYLAVHDLRPGGKRRRVAFGMDTFNNLHVVTNPWEAAVSPDGKTMYVVYAGTNDMNVCRLIDDDYKEMEPAAVVPTGKNPRAVRVSPDGQTVVVYDTLDFRVGIYDARGRRQTSIQVCEPARTPEWVRGKELFNTAHPPMTSRRWISCSSCHPDGGQDARTWQNPEGLRNTTAFFGMAHTHPIHWSADRDEVHDFEYTIRGKLMGGPGLAPGRLAPKAGFDKVELTEKMSGRSKDLDALALYCNAFEFRLSPHAAAPGKLTEAAERGKTLFFSKETGCATCHSGPYFTDSALQTPYRLHDVGTSRDDPSERMGTAYDTPTLLGIYRTAPYLHDGQAATLRDVLTRCNPGDRHGRTSHLTAAEVDDLVEFLKSLPYETPPPKTANTVGG